MCELVGVDEREGDERRFLRGLFERMTLLNDFKRLRFSFVCGCWRSLSRSRLMM
jgi:hypothetical protein